MVISEHVAVLALVDYPAFLADLLVGLEAVQADPFLIVLHQTLPVIYLINLDLQIILLMKIYLLISSES